MQKIRLIFFNIIFFSFISPAVLSLEKTVTIFDVKTGMHYEDLPSMHFMLFACGTNGGPPGRKLPNGFADFAKCEKEDNSQLKEVYFEYDDEALYWALANYEKRLVRFQGTKVMAYSSILSLLFDDNGIVKGIRIMTDPRASLFERKKAVLLKKHLEGMWGKDPWECKDVPKLDGETAVSEKQAFIKDICMKFQKDKFIILQSRYFRKKGQTGFTPSGNPTLSYFESWTKVEVYSNDVKLTKYVH